MGAVADNRSVDYDKVSRIYDTSRGANAETIQKLTELLRIGGDSLILDMGCGTGNYASALRHVAKCVAGIDISTGMLKSARAKHSSLRLVSGDVTRLPFGSQVFDGAFAVQVLHHIRDRGRFLREAHRVLKRGAYLAIDNCSHRQMRTFWLYHYFPKGLELDLARIPDSAEIALLLESVGFSDVGIEISYQDIALEHDKPERYLDKDYRDGQSTFCLLAEADIERGCRKLQEDIASGAAQRVIGECEKKEQRVGGSCIIHARKT